MNAPPEIRQLVERFQLHRDAYRSAHYNETQVRREFVDPFFKALGWDVDNELGYAEAYKDVIHEDALKFGGSTKAPDYCFRIGGVRKYFVETKRPSVNLKLDPEPAYQLRRYAWSAKLPLSILTDFEELCVYNCRVRPQKTDKASNERVLYITFDEYLDRWDEIAGIFSREAILLGAFDKYAESKKKRGTAEVDEAFLGEIEGWRDVLARNLALRNPGLSQRELNYGVQKTIDRIIFLRICEDRGIEPTDRLRSVTNGPNLYPRLCQLFRAADDRYNSGLFHFQSEKGRPEDADEWTLELTVDDKPLKDIITSLYYPDSPYEFSVLPADILGQVYEQFLGKVIRLTKGHQARVEEKPEVRKAGGVYYTPTYIVDYIVANTVGKLLEGKTAYEVAARTKTWRPAKQGRPLAVLDPACGSGSFLIGAYQYLLDWYRDWYAANNPDHWLRLKEPTIRDTVRNLSSPSGRGAGGEGVPGDGIATYRLTTSEKKRILLDHIFGVDIDAQAVEVTKLSLLLKVLEGETRETLQRQLFARQRALPDLGNNIKCGNSLIGPDFYDGRQLGMFDEEELLRINAFDWPSEFPDIMASGGFDAVIANPPYGALFDADQATYLRQRYSTLANSLDSFLIFMEAALSWLRPSGALGMIIPSGWVANPSARPLRELFLDHFQPRSFVSLPFDVFGSAYIDTCIITANKKDNAADGLTDTVQLVVFPFRHRITSADEFADFRKQGDPRPWRNAPDHEFYITCSSTEQHLLMRLNHAPNTLDDFARVKRGIETFNPVPERTTVDNPATAFTGTLQRYCLLHGDPSWIAYTPDIVKSKPRRYFDGPRILVRQVLSRRYRLQAVYAEDFFLTNQSVQSLIPREDLAEPILLALLAAINSKLMSWYFRNMTSVARRDDFPKIIIAQTRSLPVFDLEASNITGLTKRTLERNDLGKRLREIRGSHERAVLTRRIAALDREIDHCIYELYGLDKDERRLVEDLIPDEHP